MSMDNNSASLTEPLLLDAEPDASASVMVPIPESPPEDLTVPLIPSSKAEHAPLFSHEEDPPTPLPVSSTFWPCTFNLSKVVLGASMMAIPKAFSLLGALLGGVMLAVVALLTTFSISGMVSTSEALRIHTYPALVSRTCGRFASALLQIGIATTCFGNMVVYLIVIADIMIGAPPTFSGLLPEVLKISPDSIFVSRPLILGVLTLFILAPLVSMRNMSRLAPFNIIGVGAVFAFALTSMALAVAAIATGNAYPIKWEPDWDYVHGNMFAVFAQVAGIAPLLLNSNVCHQSIHPLMPLLKPWSVRHMNALVSTTLFICNALYVVIALSLITTFGPSLDSDALNNLSSSAIAPLVGPVAAHLLACGVRLSFLVCLLGSYVLLMYPLRSVVIEALPGGLEDLEDVAAGGRGKWWHLVTAVMLMCVYITGVFVPNVWTALEFVGATSVSLMSFIIPGLVLVVTGGVVGGRVKMGVNRAGGVLVMVIGCFLFVNGILTTFVFKSGE